MHPRARSSEAPITSPRHSQAKSIDDSPGRGFPPGNDQVLHYCAEHALIVLSRRYTEALEPHVRSLMEQLQQTISPERGLSLKTEGAALAMSAAFRLAKAEHRKSALRPRKPTMVATL